MVLFDNEGVALRIFVYWAYGDVLVPFIDFDIEYDLEWLNLFLLNEFEWLFNKFGCWNNEEIETDFGEFSLLCWLFWE